MKTKAVKTKQLRDNLSSYLREVRAGVRILVLDRDEVVAELREPSGLYPPPLSSKAEELVSQAKLIPARCEAVECPKSPVTLPAGSAARYLDADREEPYGTVR
ncbi:MAG: hypothetical protein ABR590_02535 [Spirochaetia bacterium]